MPYFDYSCESCNQEFEKNLKIAEREKPTQEPCESCGGKVRMVYAKPHIGDPWHHAGKKVDEGFKDRLREIKKSHLHSTINV